MTTATLSGELGSYLAAAGRVWIDQPKKEYQRKPVEGPPVLGANQLAIADALKPEARERIHADAVRFAAEALAAFDRGRR